MKCLVDFLWILESLGKYHFFRQLVSLVLGVKLMEINSNWFSRMANLGSVNL